MSVQIIGALTQRELPARTLPIASIIVHTTGDQNLDKIIRYYQDPDGLQPHYMIDTTGVIRRFVMEDHVAYHCKIDVHEARIYQLGYQEWSTWVWRDDRPVHTGSEFSGYRSWRDTWRDRYQSPLELVTGEHPNAVSVGIELQATDHPGLYTPEQYTALANLCMDISARTGVPLDRAHVLGHQDCSPMRRSSALGGWDPGDLFKWNQLWDLVRGSELVA